MAASTEENLGRVKAKRRGRYARSPGIPGAFQPTGRQWRHLRWLAAYRILSICQFALLAGRAQHTVRQQLRGLFDAGLIDVIPVNRAALAGAEEPDDASLLFGSAPNIYVPTKRGLSLLVDRGLIRREELQRQGYSFGPRSSSALAHTLFIRDVRVWLERTSVRYGGAHQVVRWQDGGDAAMELRRESPPLSVVPDAWFVYRFRVGEGANVLVGIVECDRGTERGLLRWKEKLIAYQFLFRGTRLKEITGYDQARVLVLTLDARRREQLMQMILKFDQEHNLGGGLASRFWLADRKVFNQADFALECWRNARSERLQRLLPLEIIA